MEHLISIVIPTYKRNEIANECLNSILNCHLENLDIIVVNDDKENEFRSNLHHSNLRVVSNPGKGVASARNFGASLAKSDLLLFLDDDMLVHRTAIETAVSFLKQNKQKSYNANWIYPEKLTAAIVKTSFGRYLISKNFTSLKGWNEGNGIWKENTLIATDGITSQFFAIHKSDFEKAGVYNQDFPYAGFEDHEFSQRLRKNNIQNYIDTSTTIYHNESDRVEIKNWMERKMRGGITRKVAVEKGFSELKLEYSIIKRILLKSIIVIRPLLFLKLQALSKIKILDPVSHLIINILLAASIFEGYTSNKIK